MRLWTRRIVQGWLIVLLVAGWVAPILAQDDAQDAATEAEPADPLATVRMYHERARKLDARGNLPAAWNAFDKRLDDAEEVPPTAAEIADLEAEGRRLVARASFLREVEEARQPLAELLQRYDRALDRIARLTDIELDPALTGDRAADRLLVLLERQRLERQVELDSLRVANRRLQEMVGGQVAAQDSIITQLRVELSALRKKLWETELRAGVAEADRSAAESALTRRQQREQMLAQIRADLGEEAGEVLVTAAGRIVVQVPGLEFQVGEAHLAPGQADLMNLIADIVGRFPEATVRIEGHTDDTGSRASNLELSRRRAATVAGGVERRLDLPEGTIAVVGHGPDRPVAPNSTAEGRARNRRIDIVIDP
ncbi:OmpA family protein [bacterium]|nr:OmpA family protein [bacterium]